MIRNKRLLIVSALVLTAGGIGTKIALHLHREKKAMAMIQTFKMEPWPVGRYLIDAPQGAEMDYAQGYRGAGADVEVFPCSFYATKQLVQDRVKELQEVKHLEGGTLLERYVESKALPNTWILYRWKGRTYKGNVLDIDAYHLKKKSTPQKPFEENMYLFKFGRGTDVNEDEMRQDQSELEDLFRRVRIRDPREIPGEPGFCTAYSFFPGEPTEKPHSEHVMIMYSIPGHTDIFLRFETRLLTPTTIAVTRKLLDRMKDADGVPLFKVLTIDKLRARDRNAGGLHGQEYVQMIKEDGLWNYHFIWEYPGEGDSWEKPSMSLELANAREEGSTAPLSMTKEEALALWDATLDSIRIRPTQAAAVDQGSKQP